MAQLTGTGLWSNMMNHELFGEIFRQYTIPLFYYAAVCGGFGNLVYSHLQPSGTALLNIPKNK
jgi:hypothetical protein